MIRFKKYERQQLIDQSLPSCQIQPAEAGDPGAFKKPAAGKHGFAVLASYAIRKTLTSTGGNDIQHNAANTYGLRQKPHDLMEGYGLALYECRRQ